MSYKTVLKSTIISTDDTKKMDLFEKGRLVQSLLSDTFPFGYLMTSATNNSKDYLMTAEDVRLFIDDTIKEVSEQVNSTLDENYTFSSYSIDCLFEKPISDLDKSNMHWAFNEEKEKI